MWWENLDKIISAQMLWSLQTARGWATWTHFFVPSHTIISLLVGDKWAFHFRPVKLKRWSHVPLHNLQHVTPHWACAYISFGLGWLHLDMHAHACACVVLPLHADIVIRMWHWAVFCQYSWWWERVKIKRGILWTMALIEFAPNGLKGDGVGSIGLMRSLPLLLQRSGDASSSLWGGH